MMFIRIFCVLLLLVLFSCQTESPPVPKPRGFPKIVYPEKSYQSFDKDYCEFRFEYPVYAQIQQDTSFFDRKPGHDCWFDIVIPAFDARLHCSYYPVDSRSSFEKLQQDAFNMVSKHNVKASYIDEFQIHKPNRVSGFVFDIEGPAASPFQFYLTDTTRHFLRGALYFNTQARPDSLAPVFDFVKEDIMHIINTFSWE